MKYQKNFRKRIKHSTKNISASLENSSDRLHHKCKQEYTISRNISSSGNRVSQKISKNVLTGSRIEECYKYNYFKNKNDN